MSQISNQPRLWRSPGEKKIIQPTTQAKDAANPEHERSKKLKNNKTKNRGKHNDTARQHDGSLTKKCSISPLIDSHSQLPSPGLLQVQADLNAISTLTSLNDQRRSPAAELPSSSGDPILNRMQEIDLKLMKYQQEKMSIDEIILQYQKEKMSIEQNTMQLQNERFQLLSSMLAQSNNANTQLLASGLSKIRPQEPLTIVGPNPELPSVIDLTGKNMKIKPKSNSKKRSIETEHRDVEHPSKKSKLSPKESSHSKNSKSRKSSETSSKSTVTISEQFRGHSQRSKLNEINEDNITVDLTIDKRPTAKTSTAVNSWHPSDVSPESFSLNNYRHLITKECCIKLKRFTRDQLNKILSSPILSETSKKDRVISSLSTSNLESKSLSGSIEDDTTEDTKIQPEPDKISESDFLGFYTPTSTFNGRFVGHRMPIVFMQVSLFLMQLIKYSNAFMYKVLHTNVSLSLFTFLVLL